MIFKLTVINFSSKNNNFRKSPAKISDSNKINMQTCMSQRPGSRNAGGGGRGHRTRRGGQGYGKI